MVVGRGCAGRGRLGRAGTWRRSARRARARTRVVRGALEMIAGEGTGTRERRGIEDGLEVAICSAHSRRARVGVLCCGS